MSPIGAMCEEAVDRLRLEIFTSFIKHSVEVQTAFIAAKRRSLSTFNEIHEDVLTMRRKHRPAASGLLLRNYLYIPKDPI